MIQFSHTPSKNKKGEIIFNDSYTIHGDELEELIKFALTKVRPQSKEWTEKSLREELPQNKYAYIEKNAGCQRTFEIYYTPEAKGKYSFQPSINKLRKELIGNIFYLLSSNGLNKIEFPDDLEDKTFVYWSDKNGDSYESAVKVVEFQDGGLYLGVENDDGELYWLDNLDMACKNLDWLESIRENILVVLETKDIVTT